VKFHELSPLIINKNTNFGFSLFYVDNSAYCNFSE